MLALNNVHPVTHAVANTIKHVAIIFESATYTHTHLHPHLIRSLID